MPIHDDAGEGHQKVEVPSSDGSILTSEINATSRPRLVAPCRRVESRRGRYKADLQIVVARAARNPEVLPALVRRLGCAFISVTEAKMSRRCYAPHRTGESRCPSIQVAFALMLG